MASYETTITRNDIDIEVAVEYNYIGGSRGHRDSYGAPEEPDDDPTIEVESVVDAMGQAVVLTPAEAKRIEAELWKYVAS